MSMDYNSQEVIGRLGANATIRDGGENRKFISLRVACNKRITRRGANGDEQIIEHTEWFDIEFSASSRQAQYFEKYCVKGATVHARGETETLEYEGSDSKMKKRTIVSCVARDIQVDTSRASGNRSESRQEHHSSQVHPQQEQQSGGRRAPAEAPSGSKRDDLMDFSPGGSQR